MSFLRRLFGTEAPPVPPRAPVATSRALERLFRVLCPDEDEEARPEVLFLGPPRGHQIEFFTHQGCRVSVEDLSEFLGWAARAEAGETDDPAPLGWDLPADHFDAALLLDLVDRFDDESARQLLKAVRGVVRPGGLVFLLSDSRATGEPVAPPEVVFDGRSFRVEAGRGAPRRRRVRPNRDLMRLFGELSVVQVQLRSDGLREVLLRRAQA